MEKGWELDGGSTTNRLSGLLVKIGKVVKVICVMKKK